MKIGIPKERRNFEYRVGLTPNGVHQLVEAGHQCIIEHDAGMGAGFNDQEYEQAGGQIAATTQEALGEVEMIVKVARPLYDELDLIKDECIIVGLLHLASARQDKIAIFQGKKLNAFALEQIELDNGDTPVRRPLAQMGGRLAAQIGARLLQNNAGGKGVLLGGIPGVPPAEVVVLGAGAAGTNAIRGFVSMGAHVTVLDVSMNALEAIYEKAPSVVTLLSNPRNIARSVAYADIIIGAVMVPGERTPVIVTREMVKSMRARSVILDLSIDEGGCVETSRPTTHEHPSFVDEGVIHYCVPNVPSVVARTATYAYTNAAIPFVLDIANNGVEQATKSNTAVERATSILHGQLKHIARMKQ